MTRFFDSVTGVLRLCRPIILALGTLLLAVGSTWFADVVQGKKSLLFLTQKFSSAEVGWDPDWLSIVISLIVFLFGAAFVYIASKSYLPVESLQKIETQRARSGLIVFLSAPSSVGAIQQVKLGSQVILEGVPEPITISGGAKSIETDSKSFDNSGSRKNVAQLLRAIRPHLFKLQSLVLIGSSPSTEQAKSGGGSGGEYKSQVSKLLSCYVDPSKIISDLRDVDFEDLDGVYQVLELAISELKKKHGLSERDIMIDVTGGQKTASIAAALVTLHRSKLEFQYVSTTTQKPMSFNVISVSQGRMS